MKDLCFTINIDYVENITQVKNILEQISTIIKTPNESEKIHTIFNHYLEDYELFSKNYIEKTEVTNDKLNDFINVYILLYCYLIINEQSTILENKFNIESWWFFKQSDFITMLEDFDIVEMMNQYNTEYHSVQANVVDVSAQESSEFRRMDDD